MKKTAPNKRALIRSLALISVALCCGLDGFSALSASTISGTRGAASQQAAYATNESETSIFKKNTPMSWIEEKEAPIKKNAACTAENRIIDADKVQIWPGL